MSSMAPGEVPTKPIRTAPNTQLDYLLEVVSRIEGGVQLTQVTLQNLIIEYQREHVRVVDMASSAHDRIDHLEVDVEKLTVCVQQMKDVIQPVLFVNKILAWVLVAFGGSVVALIWAIITHQVSMVFP